MDARLRFTVADLELFPDDGHRYEVIDGELYVSTAPHFRHQHVVARLVGAFARWDPGSQHGIVLPSAGILFAYDSGVIPDLVWISAARLSQVLDEDGKLHAAPELVVEVLSPGPENERRDREIKLKLYSRQGVLEYWIADRDRQAVQVYRRVNAVLELALTLGPTDQVTSPLLPGFAVTVGDLFAFPAW